MKESLINAGGMSTPPHLTAELRICADSDPLDDQSFMRTDGCANSACLESFPVSDTMACTYVGECLTEIASVKWNEEPAIKVVKTAIAVGHANSAKKNKETCGQESQEHLLSPLRALMDNLTLDGRESNDQTIARMTDLEAKLTQRRTFQASSRK